MTALLGTLNVAGLLRGARLVVFGGTGFLGKMFWSMLLDRYPEIGCIILVVRSKGGVEPAERFWRDIATSETLEPLRRELGSGFEAFLRAKVLVVDGDMARPLCGLDESLVLRFRGTTAAVINVAGVVDFNPALDDALDANAFGAQNLVALARALGNVPVLHTSTCYVAGMRRGPIYEEHPCEVPFPRAGELDPGLWDPDREIAEGLDLIAQARHRSEDAFRQSDLAGRARANLIRRGEPAHGEAFDRELARVKRRFISERLVEAGLERATYWGWPNVYTYTKAIGEQIIARSGLRFAIARPACCESTVAFPFPAFNEGVNTSAPLIYLMMKGQLDILAGHVPLDLVPADYVSAGMILAMAELLEGTAKPVYQFGAADVNPCTAQRFGELVGLYKRKHFQRKGKGNALWNALAARFEPTFVDRARFDALGPPAKANVSREVASLLRKTLPAFAPAAEALEGFARREAKIAQIQSLFEPFSSSVVGPFDCSHTRAAHARLADEDKAKLPWAPEQIDWANWMMNVHMPAMEKRIIPDMDRRLQKGESKGPRPLAAHATLVSLVDEMAERYDLALAVQRVTDDGLTRTTYRDLRHRSVALAARLAAAGVRPGHRVALAAQNHPDWSVAYFGIVRAGATAVPLDPALDGASWGHLLAESGARVVIWNDTVKSRASVAQAHPGLLELDLHEATEGDDALVPPEVVVAPGDVASLIYTSGTTGRPKGVLLTHANFTSLLAALAPIFPLSEGDAVLSVLPLHHTFEFTCGLLLPLSRGARVVSLGELTGEGVAHGLRAVRPAAMVGVPAFWHLLERRILQRIEARGAMARAAFDAATEVTRWLAENLGVDAGRLLFGHVHARTGGRVRWLISGGAALPNETKELFAGLGLSLTEGYGLTEAAPVLTVSRPGNRIERGVGESLPGVELRIANADGSGVGEVIARGPNVMKGYTDAETTRLAIDAEGWLHTGDLGRLDAKGRLQIVGRSKNVVISPTGENVYPEDVERRLGTVPHIVELAVVGVDVKGSERLACLAVPTRGPGLERGKLNERARQSLGAAIDELPSSQRPAIVHLYDAPLPRTTTRKVKREDVRSIIERLNAALARLDDTRAGTSPVRSAIGAVRGLSVGEVTDQSKLRGELGFDSLMLTELLESLEARFGAIDPERLQACTTVADVEELVRGMESPVARHVADAAERSSEAPLILPGFVQELGKALVGKVQDLFYGEVMKPRVYGRAHLPHNRNVIVVANHASHLDMGLVRHALGRYGDGIVSLAAQDYFFESGFKRAFFENLTNLRAIDRKASLRQAIRQASEVIEAGKTVLVFPEGTRSSTGEIQEFRPLIGHLSLVHGVDVLPVFLGGTHAAMPKGTKVPMRRDLLARIGPPLRAGDLRRLTAAMAPADAAREVARVARAAVLALGEGKVLDLSSTRRSDELVVEIEHPLIQLFGELEAKFRAGEVEKPVSYYVSLGADERAKWTVRVDALACDVRPGKPEGGQADCVLKTSPEIFAKIVRESYVPSPADFLSGAVKSNDVALLMTFQKVFQLDDPS